MNKHKVYIDIETFSSVDIRTAGLFKYAESDDFEMLLLAYAIDDGDVELIDLTDGGEITRQKLLEVKRLLENPDYIKCAHNAHFEMECLERALHIIIRPSRWECTMVKGMYRGYPASLEKMGEALDMPEDKAKLRTGKALINYFCKPCKPTKTNGSRTRNLPKHAPEKWELFKEYCKRDVEVAREIDKLLPNTPQSVQAEWLRDYLVNWRGIAVDEDLVEAAIAIDEEAKSAHLDTIKRITGVDNPRSRAQVLKWLNNTVDEDISSLNAASVKELLESDLTDDARAVLTAWQGLGKTSTKKYETLKMATQRDGRVRGLLQFYGASRTGRWAGRLVQPHNLPRGDVYDLNQARELVRAGRREDIELLHGSVPKTLSGLIRTSFVPADGCKFVICDYSAIEARVLAWLAGEHWVLEEFKGDGKIYEATAARMYNLDKSTIVKGHPNYAYRQKGKIATLALGYQGAVGALRQMGASEEEFTDDELRGLVRAWRVANPCIAELWRYTEMMAKSTISSDYYSGTNPMIPISFRLKPNAVTGVDLEVGLPSGRALYYHNPVVVDDAIYYTDYTHTGKTKEQTYGGKLVENIVQAIARDVLADAINRISTELVMGALNAHIVLHVHDELVVEAEAKDAERVQELLEVAFSVPPSWAEGLPLKGESFISNYFIFLYYNCINF